MSHLRCLSVLQRLAGPRTAPPVGGGGHLIETFIHNRYSGTGRGEELLRMIRTRIAVHIWRMHGRMFFIRQLINQVDLLIDMGHLFAGTRLA